MENSGSIFKLGICELQSWIPALDAFSLVGKLGLFERSEHWLFTSAHFSKCSNYHSLELGIREELLPGMM